MDWIRRNPKVAAAVSALAVLCVVVIVWGVTGGSSSSSSARTLGEPTPGGQMLATPTATPSRLLDGMPTPSGSLLSGLGASDGGPGSSVGMHLPGLPGGTLFKNFPRHQLKLLVTSEGDIGTVGWIIPTSLRKSYGIAKNVKHEWDLATVVYGDPDYARIWLQAGAIGFPITCTITVDGVVTEHRSTDGPYGRLLCQG
jgi:hypothetical protein